MARHRLLADTAHPCPKEQRGRYFVLEGPILFATVCDQEKNSTQVLKILTKSTELSSGSL